MFNIVYPRVLKLHLLTPEVSQHCAIQSPLDSHAEEKLQNDIGLKTTLETATFFSSFFPIPLSNIQQRFSNPLSTFSFRVNANLTLREFYMPKNSGLWKQIQPTGGM